MKVQNINLLSKIIFNRVALIWKLSKIKLRFLRRFTQLAIIVAISLTLLGYYPTFAIPPIKRSYVQANALEQSAEIIAQSFSKPLILPHPGYLSTKFSNWHPGIDIAVGLGMPIHPIIDGEVVTVGRDLFGLGNYVEIIHEKGFKSKYGHMGKIYVKKGDKVTPENILGEVGLTGHTSGPHTHLEITLNDKFIDPQTLLPELPKL
ncbi:MAG: M23 family metallopeptidase [Candidatus Daviesbacteria bacterium]|nr:M23 family metallopeptidase [Candidatus Daviesbacteria bacterium]